MPKISVIVPVYNVEKYLERCLESLINQTFKDIEIIVINDGSTDRSLGLLVEIQKRDNRIKVIDKNNEGLSQTRNRGINNSTGEYITFVDSDDWIDLNMLSALYSKISKDGSDISMCSYKREYMDKSLPKQLNLPDEILLDSKKASKYMYRRIVGPVGNELEKPENLDSLVTAWGKLYRTDLLVKNSVEFIDTKLIGTEDLLFNIYAFKYTSKVSVIDEPLYHYWKGNSNSLTAEYKPKLNEQWNIKGKLIKKHLDFHNEDKEFYLALENRICLGTLGLGLNECSQQNKVSTIKKIKNINKILEDESIKKAFKGFKLEYLPIHWRIYFMFNKYKIAPASYFTLVSINQLRKFI